MNESSQPHSFVVREANPGDGPALEALAGQCGLAFAAERDLERPGGLVLVAQEGEAVVAFVSVQLAADEAELLDLCVLASNRRRGIARTLVLAVMNRLRPRGATRMLLEVRRGNLPALALYRTLGFELAGERKRYYAGGEDALIFACVLQG